MLTKHHWLTNLPRPFINNFDSTSKKHYCIKYFSYSSLHLTSYMNQYKKNIALSAVPLYIFICLFIYKGKYYRNQKFNTKIKSKRVFKMNFR